MTQKKEYNKTFLFFLQFLKSQGSIKTWGEASTLYFKETGEDLLPDNLSRLCKKTVVGDISTSLLFDYAKKYSYKSLTPEKVNGESDKSGMFFEVLEETKTLRVPFSITAKDLVEKFNVIEDKDDADTVRQKIMHKMADPIFLLEYLHFDPVEYEVAEYKIGSWSIPVKEETEDGKSVAVVLNETYKIIIRRRKNLEIYDERIIDKLVEKSRESLNEFLKQEQIAPFRLLPQIEIPKYSGQLLNDDLMLVVPDAELHLGKLTSITDYEDYSSKQALWRYAYIMGSEIAKIQSQCQARTLLYGIGNDFFNSDTMDAKTGAGTQQTDDSRFNEMWLSGKTAHVHAIESMKSIFDKIILKHSPGNHDYIKTQMLYFNLYDIFKQDDKVEIDMDIKSLHYATAHVFGDNLIVFHHGKHPEPKKGLNDDDLVELVDKQFAEETRKTKNTYVIAGHLHTSSENNFSSRRIKKGKCVLRTGSPTGIGSWEVGSGYFGEKVHNAYLFHRTKGLVATYNIVIDQEDLSKKIGSMDRKLSSNLCDEVEKSIAKADTGIRGRSAMRDIKVMDKKISQIESNYEDKLSGILQLLEINVPIEEIPEEKRALILDCMGYGEEVKALVDRKSQIKEYELGLKRDK